MKCQAHSLVCLFHYAICAVLAITGILGMPSGLQGAQERRATVPEMPIPINEDVFRRSLDYHWISKPVIESYVLDDMEDLSTWEHQGLGNLSITNERAKAGSYSMRLTSPTVTDAPGSVIGFPHGEASAVRKVNGEDWTEYNRISFWAYPTLPGFHTIAMTVILFNEGEEQVPGPHAGRNGRHYLLLRPNEWNHCVWEIPHLGRDKVTGVKLQYRLQGNEPGATNTVTYDLDLLELQKIDADYYEGWEVAPGNIAYCHLGYQPESPKTALSRNLASDTFSIVRQEDGKKVLTKTVEIQQTSTGTFQVLDFSELQEPGTYFIQSGETQTPPFPINEDIMRETIVKTINFFYSERCGTAVEGVHDYCHGDWICQHEPTGPRYSRAYQRDLQIIVNGGWHDAGNMAQGTGTTAQSTQAMLELSERLADSDPALSERLFEEALWGLDWLLRTRFGDGYRVHWAPMDFWTDNIIGTVDDVKFKANNSVYNNFVCASAEAVAARVLQDRAPIRASYCLKSAEEDWRFADDLTKRWMETGVYGGGETNEKFILDAVAAGLLSSLELYRTTGKPFYRDRAIEYADYITECQQRTIPDWDIPFTGFFYTDTNKEKIYRYEHLSREYMVPLGLAILCRMFPDEPDWSNWHAALALYSKYYVDATEFTQPYELLPASIYRADEHNDPVESFRVPVARGFVPESFRNQILNGVKLSDDYYLRRFPAWFAFRGNSSVMLPQAKGLFASANFRNDERLEGICRKQLEWNLGLNPFAQSLMYGVGHKYTSMYSTLGGNMVGALPVGIQTDYDKDIPYWPSDVCYNFKEVWVHPSSLWLWVMTDWIDAAEKKKASPEVWFDLAVARNEKDGVVIACNASGSGEATFALRGWNLTPKEKTVTVNFGAGNETPMEWEFIIDDASMPGVVAVIPNNELSQLKDIVVSEKQ